MTKKSIVFSTKETAVRKEIALTRDDLSREEVQHLVDTMRPEESWAFSKIITFEPVHLESFAKRGEWVHLVTLVNHLSDKVGRQDATDFVKTESSMLPRLPLGLKIQLYEQFVKVLENEDYDQFDTSTVIFFRDKIFDDAKRASVFEGLDEEYIQALEHSWAGTFGELKNAVQLL